MNVCLHVYALSSKEIVLDGSYISVPNKAQAAKPKGWLLALFLLLRAGL